MVIKLSSGTDESPSGMARRLWEYLHFGWRAVTEAHTIWWLAGLAGVTLPAGLITGALAFYGEHSPALLTIVFVLLVVASTAVLLLVLGYRREGNSAHASSGALSGAAPQPTEIQARTDRRYITAAEAIAYIADESEWGVRLRAAPPDAAGMRQPPRFAAIEEFVRAARDGEIIVFGRLDRTGEHRPISQQYWLYASVDPGSALTPERLAVTISTSPYLEQRERFTRYDALTVEQRKVFRVWPRPPN